MNVACPRCARPNAPHRDACLYCGQELPLPPSGVRPQRPPEPDSKQLDAIVRKALAGRGSMGLADALSEFQQARQVGSTPRSDEEPPVAPLVADPDAGRTPEPEATPAAGPFPPADPDDEPPGAAPTSTPPPPDPPPSPPLDEAAALLAAAGTLPAASDDLESLQEAVDQAQAALDRVAAIVRRLRAQRDLGARVEATAPIEGEPVPSAPEVALPTSNLPWALVVACPGDLLAGEALATALGVDRATANQLAVSRTPRVALRSDDGAHLADLAARVQDVAGLRARAIHRDQVLALAPPRLLRSHADGVWVASDTTGAAETERSEDLGPLLLAVPGLVTVRRFKAHTNTRWARKRDDELHPTREQVLTVVDLHGPAAFFRAVEGDCDLSGLPCHVPSSNLRSWRAFVDGLPRFFHGIRVLEVRKCHPEDRPRQAGASHRDEAEASGWTVFEEHTRLARLLFED